MTIEELRNEVGALYGAEKEFVAELHKAKEEIMEGSSMSLQEHDAIYAAGISAGRARAYKQVLNIIMEN